MVLSNTLGEQWTYGFYGALITHSVFFPAAVHQWLWFVLSWLFVHSVDPPVGQVFVHVHHALMLWLGAACGALFVRFARTPRFLSTDFTARPYDSMALGGASLVVAGGYFVFSFAGFFSVPSALPATDESVSLQVAFAALAIALGGTLAVIGIVGLVAGAGGGNADAELQRRRRHERAVGVSTLKYTTLALLYAAFGNLLLVHPLWLVAIANIAAYAALWFASVVIAPRYDAYFPCGRGRSRRLALFWASVCALQLPAFIVANVTDNCLLGATASPERVEGAGCTLALNVPTVFRALVVLSVGYMVLLAVFIGLFGTARNWAREASRCC